MEGLIWMQSRWSRRALLASVGAGLLAACTNGQVSGTPYSIGVRGDGNQVTFGTDSNRQSYVVGVQSERGIGEATFAWWGSTPPHPLTILLKLRGLEHFRLAWAADTAGAGDAVKVAVNVSVGSMDNRVTQWAQHPDQGEVPLDADSPYWLPVQTHSQELHGFILGVPPAFLADAPRLWTIAWIDFYR